jgi:hypothetical protein
MYAESLKKVMPSVFQKLMRHESIETTMDHYVDTDADELAEEVWKGHQNSPTGTISGTSATAPSWHLATPSTKTGQ